jgi:hypothetical protein
MAIANTGPLNSVREVATMAATNNKSQFKEALKEYGTWQEGVMRTNLLRWNQIYPYCLILARAWTDDQGKTDYDERARFVLPLAPEQLQIQIPPAITVTKTLGGVVEEHNGIPFRMIVAQGSTGTFPLRTAVISKESQGIFGGIGAGTLQAVQQTRALANNFTSQLGSLMGSNAPQPGNSLNPMETQVELDSTGYFQMNLLRRFLEGYAEAKKVGNSDLRLIFAIFKDGLAYVVTPVMFNVRRDASAPLKYRYDLQLKAWHALDPATLMDPASISLFTKDYRSTLSKMLDTIVAAQKVIMSAVSIVNAVRADVARVLNVIRQVALVIKNIIGVLVAIIDLPRQLITALKETLVSSWAVIKSAIVGSGQDSLLGALAAYSTTQQHGTLQGRGQAERPRFPLINQAGIELPPSVLDGIFANPYTKASNDFLSLVTLNNLEIPAALQERINAEYARVAAFRPADFARMRDQINEVAASIADTVGASNTQFDTTYDRSSVATTRTPNLEDFSILYAINDVIGVLNELAAVPDVATNTTMDYVAGIAAQSGIAFQTPASKYAIPFPYDSTLENISAQYLKDPDRWMEIALLNGLREPYIDEVGFDVPLLSNGNLSEIVLADATNLKIGQPVWLQSSFVIREKRHIVNIKEVSVGNYVLTLDGPADLDKYKVASHAFLHAFLPDTVNSEQLIYIPSDIVVEDNSELAKIPGINAFDSLLEVGGVDMLLTSENDLAVTNDGDCRLAYGMSALVQRAKIALGTPKGSLMRHPNFGLPINIGQSIADLDVNSLADACKNLFTADPAFDGVSTLALKVQGPVVSINLGLFVKGQDLPLSLAINVKR